MTMYSKPALDYAKEKASEEARREADWFKSTVITLLTLAEATPSPLDNKQVSSICRHALDKNLKD